MLLRVLSQYTSRDYIKNEGKFKQRNAVERAVKREIDAKSRIMSGQARLVCVQRHQL